MTRSFRKGGGGGGAYSNDHVIQGGFSPMITTGDRGGVQNSLKSDDVYVNDPLLYYTGKKKSFINSLWKIRYAHEALYLHIAFQE